MEDWVLWMIAVGALTVGEILTMGFFLGPIAMAAVLAALVALVGGSMPLQVAAFVLGAIASLAIVRPIARRHMHTPPQIRTGTAALVGAKAVVVQPVDQDRGQVKIGGEVWSARSYDDDDVFEPGTRVEVLRIEGATALVAE